MRYAIVLIQPEGYIHSAAFNELAAVVAYGLADLGHDVSLSINRLDPDARPIVIGCHLTDPGTAARMPSGTIVLNTEQVHAREGTWNDTILEWARAFETWDYSTRNIAALSGETAMPVRHLRLGYHPALKRIESVANPDIDVLFYGSLNPRRKEILARLANAGMAVKSVFGVYGEERDALIARSRIVLNVHNYPSQIFEIVRVFYLMINGKAVVAEVDSNTAIDPAYRDGVASAPYDQIVATCQHLLDDDGARRMVERQAFDTIARLPQAELLAPLLAG